jgi:hypothetical protein
MRTRIVLGALVLTQAGCPDSRGGADTDSGSIAMPEADASTDGSDDAGPSEAGPTMLPPYERTLVTRSLMPTSPKNLLRDPLIGGDGTTSYGQFRAFFVAGAFLPLKRTFQSVSPVGGAVSIEELRDLPADAGTATSARVMSSFLGGSGDFQASIWLSGGDANAAPLPYASVSSSLQVSILDNDGVAKVMLAPSSAPKKFGAREWVQFSTPGPAALPRGGWLTVSLRDFKVTLQLAAPEVTSSSLRTKSIRGEEGHALQTDDDRRALLQARSLDEKPPDVPRIERREDR